MIKFFRKYLKNIFLTRAFFLSLWVVVIVFVAGFFLPILFPVAQAMLVLVLLITFTDSVILFRVKDPILGHRQTPNVLSLGDENEITIELENKFGREATLEVIDELPEQFQLRDFSIHLKMEAGEKKQLSYELRPVERGEYHFHNILIYMMAGIGFVKRRVTLMEKEMVPTFPSIIQMKKFELKAFQKISHFYGMKKIRRLGHSYEFEQIKTYVQGDDLRSINWKATSRKAEIMVNQYEDERSQAIYSIIDKSRSMKMPFKGLSLLDYAINTSLVISNVALQKKDKAGLLTFSDKVGTTLKADNSRGQLRRILNQLYSEKEKPLEANYELLYQTVRNVVRGRSLLFLFTNFESTYALDRVLPIFRRLGALHLLVVVFFENTEILEFSEKPANTVEDIYHQTVASEFVANRRALVQKLNQYGIQAVLSKPDELSINTINKYLELKARGMI